jgi:hypothetical protein
MSLEGGGHVQNKEISTVLVARRHGRSRNSVFGWGTVLAALVLSVLGIRMNQIANPIQIMITVAVSMLIVFLIRVFVVGPIRAWRMMRPFSIDIASGFLESQYPHGQFRDQRVVVRLKNQSYKQHSKCVLHIMSVSNFDNTHKNFPRAIEEFSIEPGEALSIPIMSWTTRNPPLKNDNEIVVCGPVGWGWGGNVARLPCGAYDVVIRVGIPDCDPICLCCRIWIDGDALKATIA